MLFPEAFEKLREVPAANADGVLRQAPLSNHVVRKTLDQFRVGPAREFYRSQTPEKTEPLPGVRDESQLPVPVISRIVGMRLGLAANPRIGGRTDLVDSNRLGCQKV